MVMDLLDKTTVNLRPGSLNMSQVVDMPIFFLTDWKFKETLNDGENGISMVIVMKRKIVSEIMTTYFPSLLLTAITFATTFFKPFFFEAALSVNLTTMLVMTTIFISKMEGLPPTSDIKMIDIWLILCQMVPFVEVVLLTAMEYRREDERMAESKKPNITTVVKISVIEEEEELSIKWRCRKAIEYLLPNLKTIGLCLS